MQEEQGSAGSGSVGQDHTSVVAPAEIARRGAYSRRPSGKRLLFAGIGALLVAHVFDMPLIRTTFGLPVPIGTLFAAGVIAHQAVRQHRALQQLLLPPVAALFFAFGLPLLLMPFAPPVRYIFYLVTIGATVALFEWSMP